MPQKIGVFIADDHPVVVDGIKDILAEQDDMEMVGTALDGVELIQRIIKARPDIILLDVKMPHFNIFEAIDALVALVEQENAFEGELPNVVLVTSLLDPYLARKAYDEGIAGYLLKEDALSKRLPSTIRAVVAGGWAYSEGVQEVLKTPNSARGQLTFGRDQYLVLSLMVDGYTNTQIAELTGRSIETLYTMQHRVRNKLGVETNEQAITKALQEAIASLGESKKLLSGMNQSGDSPGTQPDSSEV
jgi:DNA-binding NarL/FixJ family response regulator